MTTETTINSNNAGMIHHQPGGDDRLPSYRFWSAEKRAARGKKPSSAPLPTTFLDKILGFLQPSEFHLLAPSVCRRWHQLIRSNHPRVILLNLRLVGNPESADEKPNNAGQSNHGYVSIRRPAPLDSFSLIPAALQSRFGTTFAGEGVVVTCDFKFVPESLDGLKELVGGIEEKVRKFLGGNAGVLKQTVHVLPWEVQLSGNHNLDQPEELSKLMKVLTYLDTHVLKMAFPPSVLPHILPPSINALQLCCCREFIDPLDFSPLEKLVGSTVPRPNVFGSHLQKLVLDAPLRVEENLKLGYTDPSDLVYLKYLAPTLTQLKISGFYPLTDYLGFLPTLQSLTNLTTLSIKGLDESTLPAADLAQTITSLKNLKSFHDLCNPSATFWPTLYKSLTESQTRLPLKDLTITWDVDPIDTKTLQAAIVGVLACFPNMKTLRWDLSKFGSENGKGGRNASEVACSGDMGGEKDHANDVGGVPGSVEHGTAQFPKGFVWKVAAEGLDGSAFEKLSLQDKEGEDVVETSSGSGKSNVTPGVVISIFERLMVAIQKGLLPLPRWRMVTVVGMTVNMEEMARVGRLNMTSTKAGGFGLRIRPTRL
ncbi:hypothetical protein HDU76_005565 [Blyttiomyces sp. JEL0837]|nr:hypothetical protein HDU76_005565 [Blyttiomyces sp. JEL0837]